MPNKLTRPQRAVMIWMSKGWKAYVARGNRVEVNGHPVCTVETMAALEKAGLVTRLGVAAWEPTDLGRAWRDPDRPGS